MGSEQSTKQSCRFFRLWKKIACPHCLLKGNMVNREGNNDPNESITVTGNNHEAATEFIELLNSRDQISTTMHIMFNNK